MGAWSGWNTSGSYRFLLSIFSAYSQTSGRSEPRTAPERSERAYRSSVGNALSAVSNRVYTAPHGDAVQRSRIPSPSSTLLSTYSCPPAPAVHMLSMSQPSVPSWAKLWPRWQNDFRVPVADPRLRPLWVSTAYGVSIILKYARPLQL